jgi:membrane protein implicated in regulation of membrane protease activity
MDWLFDYLASMPFWHWWVLAVVLLVVEISTGSTYFLWPAAAAVVVGAADLWPFDGNWQAQLALFAVITIALTVFATPRVRPMLNRSRKDHLTLNERGAQEIGKRATVETAFENGSGRVTYGDTAWLAESETGENFAAGVAVVVVRAEGSKLVVKAA